jgi:hypothetical protein
MTDVQLKQRFARVGGIPRFLFKSAGPPSLVNHIDAAMADIDKQQAFALNDLIKQPRRIDPGYLDSEFNSLWSLYHLVPDIYYTSYSIEIC